jgi:hypothetical protein
MTHFKVIVLIQIATMIMHLEMVVIQIVAMMTQFEIMENNDISKLLQQIFTLM